MSAPATGTRRAYSNKALVVVLLLWLGTMAAAPWILAEPDAAAGTLTAIFLPGKSEAEQYTAVVGAGGRIIRAGMFANILVVHGDDHGFSGRLKEKGALTVLSPRLAAGCLLIPASAVPD